MKVDINVRVPTHLSPTWRECLSQEHLSTLNSLNLCEYLTNMKVV